MVLPVDKDAKAMTTDLNPNYPSHACEIVIPILLKVPIYLELEVREMLPMCHVQGMEAETLSIPEPQLESSEDDSLAPATLTFSETLTNGNLSHRDSFQALLKSLAVILALVLFYYFHQGRFA
jgi:hypothetical protein